MCVFAHIFIVLCFFCFCVFFFFKQKTAYEMRISDWSSDVCSSDLSGELKTKPTQHSVKELRSIGIQPDILLCRADREIPQGDRKKMALFCNVREEAVIPALDVETIYAAPLAYHEAGLDRKSTRLNSSH